VFSAILCLHVYITDVPTYVITDVPTLLGWDLINEIACNPDSSLAHNLTLIANPDKFQHYCDLRPSPRVGKDE
jgi:hypothetical protein